MSASQTISDGKDCMIKRFLLLVATISLSGCWSLMYHIDGERCVYGGTRQGWAWGTHSSPSTWPLLVDVPFSLVLDTVLLPYDLTSFLPENLGGDDSECAISEGLNVLG